MAGDLLENYINIYIKNVCQITGISNRLQKQAYISGHFKKDRRDVQP